MYSFGIQICAHRFKWQTRKMVAETIRKKFSESFAKKIFIEKQVKDIFIQIHCCLNCRNVNQDTITPLQLSYGRQVKSGVQYIVQISSKGILKNHLTVAYLYIRAENSSTGCMSILHGFCKILWYCSILYCSILWIKQKI